MLLSVPDIKREIFDTRIRRLWNSGKEQGLLEHKTYNDDVERIVAYQRIDGKNMFAVVAVDKNLLIRPWQLKSLVAIFGCIAVTSILIALYRRVIVYQSKLENMALNDPLTGLANRYALQQIAPLYMAQAIRYKKPLSFIIFDLDKFKELNDTYGHIVGDQVLSATAHLLKRKLRNSDVIVRLGGGVWCHVARYPTGSCCDTGGPYQGTDADYPQKRNDRKFWCL